jgi:hypothetical protein
MPVGWLALLSSLMSTCIKANKYLLICFHVNVSTEREVAAEVSDGCCLYG